MSKYDTFIDNKVFQNLMVWIVLFFLIALTITAENRWMASLFIVVLFVPPIYINNIYILPYFKSKIWSFLGLFLLNAIIFTFISVYIVGLALGEKGNNSLINFFGVLLLALAFASALKIARDSFYKRQQIKEAELKLLKAQLNPHFLFNTLNNLYGLSVIKSDRLPSLMLQLSELLRYSLYNTKEEFVPLKKEIQYLENYVSLERIRLEEQTEITLNIVGNYEAKKIAPMLLIVFVENAFKHLGEIKGKQSTVAIDILIEEGELNFKCENTSDTTKPLEENLEKGKSGIGLTNVKKRLSLLYPEKYQLEIQKKKNIFLVELIVEL